MNASQYRKQRDELQLQLEQMKVELFAARAQAAAPQQPQTCQDVLKIIREFMAGSTAPDYDTRLEANIERKKLWDILSALRGPDDGNSDAKDAATAVIRWYVFKRTDIPGGMIINQDTPEYASYRISSARSYHFSRHVSAAFAALGLKLYEVNE